MDQPSDKRPVAWQPLTPRGIAAFSRATWGRLFMVQFVVALLAASTTIWFVHARWFCVIGTAIKALPPRAEIRAGRLNWPGNSPLTLAENTYLAISVDLKHQGIARSPAHIQVEFGQSDFRVFSLFGSYRGDYPRGWVVAFNQPELEPWWGAWAPAILALLGGGVIGGLMVIWAILAFIYLPVAWLVGFFNDRQLSLAGSWRLAGASLMPGALLMNAGLWLYGFGLLDVIQLTAAAAVHLVVGWIYLAYSPLSVAVHPSAEKQKENPFVHSATPRV